MVQYLERLIRKYPDQWNWLTVGLSKYQPDQKPAPSVIDSSDLGLNRKDIRKDGAGEEGRTPDLMLGKHTL